MPPIKIDHWYPFAELFPLLEGDEREALNASVRRSRGNRDPIHYRRLKDGRNQGLDGRNRLRACQDTCTKPRLEEVMLEDEEVRDFILDKNIHRRHLTRELRQKLVAELAEGGQSTRQIASVLGVSHQTVHRDLKGPTVTNVTATVAPSPATSVGPNAETVIVFEPVKPSSKPVDMLPELRLKVMPRRWPEVEQLSATVQAALLARLREGMSFDKALAEVQGIGPGAESAPAKPARAEQLVFDWGRYDAAYETLADQVDLLARIHQGPAAAKLGALLAEFGEGVKRLAGRE